MSRRGARITQADVARAIRAAKQAGAHTVRLLPDGTIQIDVQPVNDAQAQENSVAVEDEVIL